MKKDIEWLKDKTQNRIDKLPHNGIGMYSEGSRDAYQLVLQDINELDEPEVLSDKWIDEHTWNNDYVWRPFVYVDDLQNLLVPKQKEMKRAQIPEWIIEWYQGANNEFSTLEDVFDNLSHDTGYNIMDSDKFRSRIMKYGGFSKMYEALSHIYFGAYEIEEEQKYYVKDNKGNTLLRKVIKGFGIDDRKGKIVSSTKAGEASDARLTEQEIKDYDPRYMTFAKPVEELEE